MHKRTENFSKQNLFTYNRKQKRRFIFYSILGLILILFLIIYYLAFFINSDNFFSKSINGFFKHVTFQIKNLSLLGVFYASTFGGLFFLPVPMELVFLSFLKSGNFLWLVGGIYLAGIFISYSLNYWIGSKLSYISKKVISFKRFYKIKGILNRYGAWAIFGFNVLPLPSQILSAILGVFNYNKSKFYFFTLSGQIIKYLVIILGYVYIF